MTHCTHCSCITGCANKGAVEAQAAELDQNFVSGWRVECFVITELIYQTHSFKLLFTFQKHVGRYSTVVWLWENLFSS